MTSSKRRKVFAGLALLLTLALPFIMIYFASTDSFIERRKQLRERADEINRPIQSKFSNNRVVLKKNERLTVGRTALRFKAVNDKSIELDLFLLDLDPEQAYPKAITIKNAKKKMVLGGVEYRLVSVNNQFLTLKVVHFSQTP